MRPRPYTDTSFARLALADRIAHIAATTTAPVFTTSLGIEDQVITHAIAAQGLPIRIATLDTGRLFPESVALLAETERRFGIRIERFGPDAADIEAYAARYGLNGFYDSVEARHACCGLRKLKPLARALAGSDAWITGLRRGQSDARAVVPFMEEDTARGLAKFNPLADFDIEDVRDYVRKHDVPINPLHGRGYPSIGCEPCTRAIRPGEPERAGRWWWEQDLTRECGLHVGKETEAA